MNHFASLLFLLVQAVAAVSGSFPFGGWPHQPAGEWTGWGGSIFNNRFSPSKDVSSSTFRDINIHCQIPHAGGVSAIPTIFNNTAFYPTWNGTFVALDYDKCRIKWEINVTAIILAFKPLTPLQTAMLNGPFISGILASRTSPQIDKQTNVLYFATQLHALVVALDVRTGAQLGLTQINAHEAAVATLSPTLYEGILYAGVASAEELAAGSVPGYQCCSFVGNVVALKFDRFAWQFKTVWNLDMLPPRSENPKERSDWSGAGVWGSQPAIDPGRRRVFFSTGNVYTAPEAYLNCTDEQFSPTTAQNTSCLPERVWQNAVLALNLLTGEVAWVKRFGPIDVWNLACGTDGIGAQPSCSWDSGPDYDFGMAPTFVPGKGKGAKNVLTVGQKSGYLYKLDANTGDIIWATATSPGGITGGLSWGIATDDQRVYFAGINSQSRNWTLQPNYGGATVNNSVWGAASLADGRLLWETAAAENFASLAPPTDTGEVLLEYPLNGTFRGGIAVQDEYVLFGTGYKGKDGYLYVVKTEKGAGYSGYGRRG
ncbi:quinon protein alcohol dehydrogenase-like superfamily [Coniochaeta sp. 2T2.1]|nr:quinon protein alcohol dehydrogenase-like superfamily [Coniochaeta sp. 2T2.1]